MSKMKRGMIGHFWKDTDGVAALEGALVFPIFLVMLFGIFDVGRAITSNHKMITATQVIADLIAREPSVSTADIEQAISAGGLAMQPYATTTDGFGIDVVSVRFDASLEPVVLWRETRNMPADADAVEKSKGLGVENEGALIVTMVYDYTPVFGNMLIPNYKMKETAYARGRRSATVSKE